MSVGFALLFAQSDVPFQLESGGVFGEEENRFVFSNVLVGMRAKARFKITNTSKVHIKILEQVTS